MVPSTGSPRSTGWILFVLLSFLASPASPNQARRDERLSHKFQTEEDVQNSFGMGDTMEWRISSVELSDRSRKVTPDSSIMFPNAIPQPPSNTSVGRPSQGRRRTRKPIPLKLLRRLSSERDLSRIFEKYVSNVKLQNVNGQKYLVDLQGEPIDAGLGGPIRVKPVQVQIQQTKIFGGFSNRNTPSTSLQQTLAEERVGFKSRVSKPAVCEPELRTVEIPAPDDPSLIQFPRCVRLERCGGCCGSDLLACEPIRSKQTEVQVQKFMYDDETEKLEYSGTEVLILPSHVECRCNCRIKSSDCSPRHVYNSEDCVCACRNQREHELCLSERDKLWDATLCQCVCREIKVCSSGFSFNIHSCHCEVTIERGKGLEGKNPWKDHRREHRRIRPTRE